MCLDIVFALVNEGMGLARNWPYNSVGHTFADLTSGRHCTCGRMSELGTEQARRGDRGGGKAASGDRDALKLSGVRRRHFINLK